MTETKDMFEQISAILTDKKDKPFSYEELRTKKITPPSTTVCRCTLNIACLWILIQRKSLAQVLIGAAML